MKAQDVFNDRSAAFSRSPQKRSRYIPRRQAAEPSDPTKGSTDCRISLGGAWYFRLFCGISEIDGGLLKQAADLSGFEKIDLPKALLREEGLPFCFPDIPDTAGAALFCRDVDADFSGRKTFLVFEGFTGMLAVFINGIEAGFASGGGNLCEFDVTRFLSPGKNRFCIVLLSACSQSYFKSDSSRKFFGITEPFYLLTREKGHICDLVLEAALSEGFGQGNLTATLSGEFFSAGECRLFDEDGKCVANGSFDEDGKAALCLSYPRLWSTEQPDLYLFEAEVCGEFIYKYIGFKHIDFDLNEGLRLNGRKARFHGAVYDSVGKTEGEVKADILTLKQNHIDAVVLKGGAHLDRALSLCDRYGIIAVADVGISSEAFDRAGSRRIYDDGTVFPIIEEEIVGRITLIKSHTCLAGIGFFDFCGDGKNVYDAISLCKGLCGLPIFYAGEPADTVRTSSFEQRPDIYFTDRSLKCFDDPFAGKKPVAVLGKAPETDDIRVLGAFDLFPFEHLWELKAARPFFKVDEIDAGSGDFYITNLFSFCYLSHLECSFEVTSRGRVTAKGFVGALPLSPGKCEKVHVDFALPKGDENYIRFEFKRLGDCKWAKDGFSEGSVQFKLPDCTGKDDESDGAYGRAYDELYGSSDGFDRSGMTDGRGAVLSEDLRDDTGGSADTAAARSGAPQTAENDGMIIVSGKDFRYVFSKLSGCFSLLEHRGRPLCSTVGLKMFCSKRLSPAFCSTELSVDGELAVIRSEAVYMAEGQSGKQSFVAIWCVDKNGRISLDCSVPSGDFETDGVGLDLGLENTDFVYFGRGEKSGYTGIFRTKGDSRRLIRSCLFDKVKRPLCVFCSDRMTVETKNGVAAFSAGLFGGERDLCELSLCICPDREGRLLFE